jgi:hypothetical protein
MRWKEYVPVAWQVDPALALSLLDHFPATSEVKQALEQLVVEHAHAAKVRTGHKQVCVHNVAVYCCPSQKAEDCGTWCSKKL